MTCLQWVVEGVSEHCRQLISTVLQGGWRHRVWPSCFVLESLFTSLSSMESCVKGNGKTSEGVSSGAELYYVVSGGGDGEPQVLTVWGGGWGSWTVPLFSESNRCEYAWEVWIAAELQGHCKWSWIKMANKTPHAAGIQKAMQSEHIVERRKDCSEEKLTKLL